MNKSHFLWPHSRSPIANDWYGPTIYSDRIESLLREEYPEVEPVLFTSARAGITATLIQIGLKRPDLVWTPGFSSHCVLEAIAHIATPTPTATESLRAALIYHQWGFVGQSYFSKETLLIEDAVDHLFLPGHTPFAADARFLLWSLPKVLGTSGGGVVFCRDGRDAEDLRRIRQDRPSSWFQAILRIKSKTDPNVSLYWNGAEAMQGELVAPFRRQVYRCLREIRELAESRMQFMETLSPTLAKKFQGLHRLPSNLPLVPISDIKPYWGSNAIFSAGLRSFNTACAFPRANWVQCAPLPVHKDVDLSDLPIEFLSADIEAMLISI